MNTNGPVDITLYQTREGTFRCRVTMTDPLAPAEPCKVPRQITQYTRPSHSLFGATTLAAELIEIMKGFG